MTTEPEAPIAPALDAGPEADITRLSADLILAARTMPVRVASDLVRIYYTTQDQRLAIDNQIRAARADGYDPAAAEHVRVSIAAAEARAQKLLDHWTRRDPLAIWARQVCGIGPVLAAGLRAEIDVTRAAHVSSVWRFAGQDPTATWGKGEKRPHNAHLKVICWRIGDSFVKQSGRPQSLYGRIYRDEKTRLVEANDNGAFADTAAARIESGVRVPGKGTEARKALDAGMLPAGQLDLRARRKAVKVFLAHYWTAGRILAELPTTAPYAIDKLGHTHLIDPEVPYPLA